MTLSVISSGRAIHGLFAEEIRDDKPRFVGMLPGGSAVAAVVFNANVLLLRVCNGILGCIRGSVYRLEALEPKGSGTY